MKFTFGKNERLTNRKDIGLLFDEGRFLVVKPLKVLYRFSDSRGNNPLKVLITIPKRKFKHAVTRNRLRRIIREAYRLNRHLLSARLDPEKPVLMLAFIYIGDRENLTYPEVELPLKNVLLQLADELS